MKAQVLIQNPVAGGNSTTSQNRARRFVRAGRAIFIGDGERMIKFVDHHHAHKSAQLAAREEVVRSSWLDYDRSVYFGKPLTARQAAGLPMVGNISLLGLGA